MPPERSVARLVDMLEASTWVVEFVSGKTYEDYLVSKLLRSAVERQITIIGEAARLLPSDFKDAHPYIPGKSIVVQRNVITQDYDVIQHERMWRVATIHIPELIKLLRPLVPVPPSKH